ncbi:saccharopine dehydrogenase family protein [Mycetocola zhadangensis]|uniref:ATP-binding protein n=1 Tax=Mycetocola zhadangensis TaxID=1164595 RepID=A0A3L7IS55_9MICO|nr:saccharopine dehydrogenase C-terminal domain-containing protein [Mycetocola zhadangensis]RLQ81048.1 ATP-binding protein [Mycetocola zhadangensis]GGF04325.1 ATP-binding protein [Mycetocola zhadangensis]
MRILIIGTGGVGSAAARILVRRDFFEALVIADYDPARPEALAAELADARLTAAQVDASSAAEVAALIREHNITHILNAVDPRFVMPIFDGAFAGGAVYLDMAMSLSHPHPEKPHELPGVKLGDEQFAQADKWTDAGRLALVGIGVEPGLSDVFARYAEDELFSEIDELGVRDGANLVVDGYDFAPSFSIWTTIEECLNPPVIFEKDRGWFTTPPFSEPEVFDFPEGIGPVECVNVEHEEVLLMPRWTKAKRVTFKYGLGDEFIQVLQVLHKIGLDRTDPVTVKGMQVSPRDVVAASLPDPATLGDRMRGKTCAGVWVRGTGKNGKPRSTYLYHVVDNEQTMAEYGSQAVVWQTAINPVVALELLATGVWSGTGVLGPEAFDARPFLDLLAADSPRGYGSPWGVEEK